jgi:surface antigen/peptidoglycan hydrolase CwlO-like protein
MKRSTATPVSAQGITTRSILVASAVLMAIAAPISMPSSVFARDYDAEIQALQREIDQAQAQAGELRKQIGTLQQELAGIDAQKRLIQNQIDLSQAKYDKLIQQIAETEQKIKDNKDALGDTLASIYVDDKISPLEMLASSKNIGDYVDKQEYRASIQDQLSKTIDTIKKLKQDLEQQKTDVQRTLADQKNSRDALQAKENERADILAKTQGQESAYQSLAADRESKKLEVQQQQQAAIEAAMRRSGGGGTVVTLPGTSGGYPWNDSNCYVDGNAWSHGGIDGNGTDGMGYGCRQCVSYVAWRAYKETGYAPINWGNAINMPASAQAAGFSIGSTPRVGSAGVISAGAYGHVVWIDAVNGDGTVDISQYNYFNAGGSGWGHYSKMRVSAATYDTYIYF